MSEHDAPVPCYDELEGLEVTVSADGVALVRMKFAGTDEDTRRHQHAELGVIWRTFDTDPRVRAVVVTGPGDGEFYLSGRPTGRSLGSTSAELWERLSMLERDGNAIVNEMVAFTKPVVAAINGTAAGAGLTVALFSDISIVGPSSLLLDPHILLGIAAGDGGLSIWPLLTGLAKAKLYMLTSDAIDGVEAERIGLVSRVVDDDCVLDEALIYARRLAAGPPAALRFTKRALNQWLRLSGIVAHDYSFAQQALSEITGERADGPYAPFPPQVVRGDGRSPVDAPEDFN